MENVTTKVAKVYTVEQWKRDGYFNAEAGQEVSEGVYNEMLNCMPPKTLPRSKVQQALEDYDIPVHAGFLMGEPHSSDEKGRQLYLAFGMNDYGRGNHYYYLGLSHVEPEFNGFYYFFDCLGLLFNGDHTGLPDNFIPARAFKDDKEAISMAADYEATLYRLTYKHGERVETVVLYEPGEDE